MHTIGDLLTQVQSTTSPPAGTTPLLIPSTPIQLPGRRTWKLPASVDDAAPIHTAPHPAALSPTPTPETQQARRLLLNAPTVRAELTRPQPDHVAQLTTFARRPHHTYRNFLFAVAAQIGEITFYGRARMTVVEGEPRPGRSTIVEWNEEWTGDIHDAAIDITQQLFELAENDRIEPEPGARWLDATVLLGGGQDSRGAPPQWKRQLQTAAGFHAVKLDIRTDPDSAAGATLGQLTSNPPPALLVWDGWVRNPHSYTDAVQRARSDAYAQVLGTAHPHSSYANDFTEFIMHMQAVSPVLVSDDPTPADELQDWVAGAAAVKALTGSHFRLSQRVQRALASCPYPDPARMVRFIDALQQLAKDYADTGGNLGGEIPRIAAERYGIEIAMTDQQLPKSRQVDGVNLDTRPHVKVDDAKSPDRVGRIYFGIERGTGFVVDHIGLHDYT